MILINQFPETKGNSMYDLLPDLRSTEGVEMAICWFYSSEGVLNVAIKMRNESHTSLMAAWLAVKGYQFTMEDDEKCFEREGHKKYYVLKPKMDSKILDNAIPILCAGLLKTEGGKLTMEICATASVLSHSAVLETDTDTGVKEISYALGAQAYISQIRQPSWYNTDPRPLLILPDNSSGQGLALTTGYGRGQTAKMESETEVILGSIYNDILDRKLCLTKENITSSMAIFGSPGYGKSTLIQSILWQMWKKHGIPFVVIEPKMEYRNMKHLIPELKTWTSRSISTCNPLVPPHGVSYEDYIDVVLELIQQITPGPEESSHKNYFRNAYWLCLKETGKVRVQDFIVAYDRFMAGRFQGEALNFVSAGRDRLIAFFTAWAGPEFMTKISGERRISFTEHLKTPMVIEVGNVATDRLRAAYSYYLFEHIRGTVRGRRSREIQNLIVIEEAHMLLAPTMPTIIRTQIGTAIAEDRARGVSYIVSDQSAARLDMAMVALAGNVISFRMMSDSDRRSISDQLGVCPGDLNNMQKRQIWCRTNNMYYPAMIKVEVRDEILDLQP